MTSAAASYDVTVIIPTYREAIAVIQQTVKEIQTAFQSTSYTFEIVIVNDGSGETFDYTPLQGLPGVRVLEHHHNKGYGAAIKTAIHHSTSLWLAITDADGTYPNRDFPRLLAHLPEADMVVGVRRLSDVPWMRQLPKYLLNRYASFLANETIADLNTGMRLFKRELALKFWNLFPDGFSLTSTLTMASLGGGYDIAEVPIDYYKRQGKSSIHPIKDTYRFFKIVARLGLYFNPLRIFTPIAAACLGIAILKGCRDYWVVGHIGTLSGSLFVGGLQIYLMGLLAELISKRS